MQYGVKTVDGKFYTEEHWKSPDIVMQSAHGHGIKRMTEWGVLMFLDPKDNEWKEVDHGPKRV